MESSESKLKKIKRIVLSYLLKLNSLLLPVIAFFNLKVKLKSCSNIWVTFKWKIFDDKLLSIGSLYLLLISFILD